MEENSEEKNNVKQLKKVVGALKISFDNEQKLRKEAQELLKHEQKTRKDLETKINDLEIELKKKSDEIDSLQFNNTRLSKRVENLMEDLNSQKTQKNPGFLGSLWSGKQKDYVEKLEKQMEILQEEFQRKIEENEQIHINVFEMKNDHRKKLSKLEAELNKHIEQSQEQNKQLQNLKLIEEKLKHELKSVLTQKTELEVEITYHLQEIANLKTEYEKETTALSLNLRKCRELIHKKVIFNDENNEFFNSLNSAKKSFQNTKTKEWISRLIPASSQLLNNFSEFFKILLNKIKLLSSNLDSNTSSSTLFQILNGKLYAKIESNSVYLQNMFKEIGVLCENYDKFDPKKLVENPQNFISMFHRISSFIVFFLNSYSDVEKCFGNLDEIFKTIFPSFDFCLNLGMKIIEEEENLVDNTSVLKSFNDPLSNNFMKLKNSLANLFSYFKILINSRTLSKNFDISTSNIPFENHSFVFSKSLKELKNLSLIMEDLYNVLKDKIQVENKALDEKNSESQDSYNFLFKIKVSLTLKNHNNEMINSLHSLTNCLNSFFSILFQIYQSYYRISDKQGLENPGSSSCMIFDINKIKGATYLKAMNDFLNSAHPGINYEQSIRNEEIIQKFTEKELSYDAQIQSLKSALNLSQTKIDELISENQQSPEESQRNDEELIEYKNKLIQYESDIGKLREKYQKLCATYKVDPIEDEISEFKNLANSKALGETSPEKNSDLTINENIERGFQRISMKLMSSCNKLKPLNDLITEDIKSNEKIAIFYEKAKSIILNLSIQNEIYNEKLKAYKPATENLNKQSSQNNVDQKVEIFQKKITTLEKELLKAKEDNVSLKKNYEKQIQMLSEHLASLSKKK